MTTETHPVPPMTNPLGRYWDQPPREEIAIDDDVALMSQKTFNVLLNYSHTLPSGKYEGKMWKAHFSDGWYLRWYVNDPDDPQGLLIPSRRIVIS